MLGRPMFSLRLYRQALRLYPAAYRERFGEEMIAVFGELRDETAAKGVMAQRLFCVRETAGVFDWSPARTLARAGRRPCLATRFKQEVYDAQRIPFSESNCRTDDDHSGRGCAGNPEGRSDSGLASLRESSHRTDSSCALYIVAGRRGGARAVLRSRIDWVGDSLRHAPLGSSPIGRDLRPAKVIVLGPMRDTARRNLWQK